MTSRNTFTSLATGAFAAAIAAALFAGVSGIALAAAPPMVSISSTPLTVIVPSHPQVLIALTNSNSMDSSDNISDAGNQLLTSNGPQSAIMTWSGNINKPSSVYNGAYVGLENSTSSVNYTVPTGYTPPITGGGAGTSQLYTASVDSYTAPVTTTSGGSWSCPATYNTTIKVTSIPGGYTAVPQPTGSPPGTALGPWPTALLGSWSTAKSSTWYYNGLVTADGHNGFYSTNPGPTTMLYRPSAERLASRAAVPYGISVLSPAAMLTGLSNISELVADDGGDGGATPRSTGGGPPACGPGSIPYVPCVPPPLKYCHLWQWTPLTTTTGNQTFTYYGDNSPSRLNIAKASIASVISTYAATTDFGLMNYKVTGVGGNYSWAYYMSPPAGFTFTSTYAAPSGGNQYVMNPCYLATSTVSNNCNSVLPELLAANPGMTLTQLKAYKFMLVAARGDDPSVNDVFITAGNGFPGNTVFIEDAGPSPGTITTTNPPCSLAPTNSPYTGCNLSDYNSGNVRMSYSQTKPKIGSSGTGVMYTYPTNAGYLAYTPQVLYAQRGYLWSGNASATSGKMQVNISTAGSNPTAAQLAAYVATFTPYLEPENNVPASNAAGPVAAYATYKNAIFANAGQSPIAGMLSTALSTYGPAPAGPCPPPRYVILMTDGLPTLDMSGKNWPPLGSAAAAGYGVTASFNADGSLNTTNDQALTDTITQIAALKAAGIKTFVVGMGPGVDPTLNPQAAAALTAMSVAGGTYSANAPTGYFPGSSPAQVVTDLQNILNIISVSNVSSVSAAANTSTLNTGTTVYQASYSGYSGAYRDWTGDMQAFPVNPTNGVVSTTANWSAQCKLDAMATGAACVGTTDAGTSTGSGWSTQRVIATWNPTSGAGVPFEWSNISAAQQTALQPVDALGQDRLNYLRGDTAQEIHNGGADGFRDRSHLLGDIVDSAPLYIAAPAGAFMGDASYQSFVTANASRPAMLYVGANDGMLHAFDASTGEEKFAFIPNDVFPNLANLTATTFNLAHQFFVDGSPSAGDVKFSNSTWHTVLVGGLNDGGQSIYALDVTNPAAISNVTSTGESTLASDVLWEFSDATLGLTYSRPVIALTNVNSVANANPNGFLVFFGSGYNNSDGNDYLYAVNPQTGKLVAKINLCAAVAGACSTTIPNGLSSPVAVNSGGAVSAPVDTVYAGDLQGNLWKISVGNANPASWTVSLLFHATDASGNPQAITVTPAVSLAPRFPGVVGTVVYFGTGQYLGVPDQTTTQTQAFYAVLDNASGTVTKGQLVQQTITDVAAGASTLGGGTTTVATRTITNNSVNWTSQHGWYMNLPDSGERSITDPRLFDGEVVFTTYVPSPGASCVGGGAAFLMAVNYSNGGSFPQPQLDINGDGKLDDNDALTTGNPVGIGLGSVFASAPDLLTTSIPGLPVMKLTTLSTGTVMNVGERGGQAQQRSWIQIQ